MRGSIAKSAASIIKSARSRGQQPGGGDWHASKNARGAVTSICTASGDEITEFTGVVYDAEYITAFDPEHVRLMEDVIEDAINRRYFCPCGYEPLKCASCGEHNICHNIHALVAYRKERGL